MAVSSAYVGDLGRGYGCGEGGNRISISKQYALVASGLGERLERHERVGTRGRCRPLALRKRRAYGTFVAKDLWVW